MNRSSLWVGAVLLGVAAFGCGHDSTMPRSSRDSEPPFPNPGPTPSDIKVLTATTFLFNGQRCKLLGISESDDPEVREQSLRFTNTWFDKIGNCIGVYNASNPLRMDDGTCVVWVRGYDMYLSCLNIELVRAGLVNVDYKKWESYSFTEPTKSGEAVADWRSDLDEAKKAHGRGEKPKVLFDWPPKSGTAQH